MNEKNPFAVAIANRKKTTNSKKVKATPGSVGVHDDYSSAAFNLQDKKLHEEWRGKLIDNEVKLGNLIPANTMKSIIGEISQSIQSNIVDQAKRKSSEWAAKLGIMEKERDIEMLLSDLGEEEISGVIADIERLMDSGSFDDEN
jgi:hypothetical protein